MCNIPSLHMTVICKLTKLVEAETFLGVVLLRSSYGGTSEVIEVKFDKKTYLISKWAGLGLGF